MNETILTAAPATEYSDNQEYLLQQVKTFRMALIQALPRLDLFSQRYFLRRLIRDIGHLLEGNPPEPKQRHLQDLQTEAEARLATLLANR